MIKHGFDPINPTLDNNVVEHRKTKRPFSWYFAIMKKNFDLFKTSLFLMQNRCLNRNKAATY